MDFGHALDALKEGRWVRRSGWNGKGMYLYIRDAHSYNVPDGPCKGAWITLERCIVMFTAQRKHQPGWLASQQDMLCDDWEIVPFEEMG